MSGPSWSTIFARRQAFSGTLGGASLCSSMEEQFRPKETVGGSSPFRGTMRRAAVGGIEVSRQAKLHEPWPGTAGAPALLADLTVHCLP